MVDESGNFAAEMGKTTDHSQGDLPRSKSRSSDKPAQSGDSEAPAASEGPVSELETRGSDGKARQCDHILLQAQRIQFHDPTNGTLQTVTASDELPQSV